MIIGHIGVAFGARWKVPTAPLWLLLVATFLPDFFRAALRFAGFEEYAVLGSHRLPWVAWLAIGAAAIAYFATRHLATAVATGALVLLHVVCDLISGTKELWPGADVAFGLQLQAPRLEFMLEAAMLLGGIWLLRKTTAPRWASGVAFVGLLLAGEALYVTSRVEPRFARRALRLVRRETRFERNVRENERRETPPM